MIIYNDIPIGRSSHGRFFVLNTGRVTATIVSITLTGLARSDYALATECTLRLAPNSGCLVDSTFTPSMLGRRDAAIEIVVANDYNSPYIVDLVGIAVPRH